MTSPSENPGRTIRRVAILFAGGPAPAANAVISTAAVSFLSNGIEVVGILHGYSQPGRSTAPTARSARGTRLHPPRPRAASAARATAAAS